MTQLAVQGNRRYRRELLVNTIFRSGREQVTRTEPSEVTKRTMRMSLVSTMLIGAVPRSLATLRIVAKQASKLIDLLVEVAAASPGVVAQSQAAIAIHSLFMTPPRKREHTHRDYAIFGC